MDSSAADEFRGGHVRDLEPRGNGAISIVLELDASDRCCVGFSPGAPGAFSAPFGRFREMSGSPHDRPVPALPLQFFLIVILGTALALGILANFDVSLPFFPNSYRATSDCSFDAQTTFANSPLTGWPREAAIGRLAATCMATKGFFWREWGDDCYRVAPHGETGGYPAVLPHCWSRW
jgi:hypothetical protein